MTHTLTQNPNWRNAKAHRNAIPDDILSRLRWVGSGPMPGLNGEAHTYLHCPSGVFVLVVDYEDGGWDAFVPASDSNSVSETVDALRARLSESQPAA